MTLDEELNGTTEPTQDQIYRRRICHLEDELAVVLKDVEALTKFAEFCDFHHRSCTGLQGQHLECDCGYSAARYELINALGQMSIVNIEDQPLADCQVSSDEDEIKCASCGDRPVPNYRVKIGSVLCINCSTEQRVSKHE